MEWTHRLEQLWRAARATQTALPSASREYVRQMLRIARDNAQDLALANGFYRAACTACGTLFVPGVTVRVRETRAPARRRGGRHIVDAAALMRDAPRSTRQLRYHCRVCDHATLFPVSDSIAAPAQGVSECGGGAAAQTALSPRAADAALPPDEARRRAQLQRVLQRSGNSTLLSFLNKR